MLFQINRDFKARLILCCNRGRSSRAVKRIFEENRLQQPGTYLQDTHSAPSTRGSSRSSFKRRAPSDINNQLSLSSPRRKKNNTVRPIADDQCCKFSIQFICNIADERWYIRRNKNNCFSHTGHLPVCPNHVDVSINHLDVKVDQYVCELLDELINASQISNLVFQKFGINISDNAIRQYHQKRLGPLLNDAILEPFGSAVDRLISDFKKRNDSSFMYVTHSIDSGFVTYANESKMSDSSQILDSNVISVYEDQVSKWRLALKLKDDRTLLVAFAWCHDEELRLARMFPEFMACDTTFGVTKEQRNLFLFAGIDGNNKTFTAMRCFMPSKELRAYNWAMRAALPILLTQKTLSLNHCIASDAEYAIYTPLRSMMNNVNCLKKSCHRLDKYHLFTKPWVETVSIKLGEDDTVISSVKKLRHMISKIFNYVESEREMNSTIKHYKHYFSIIKDSLKSEPACVSIEKIINAIDNNLLYISHYYFKDVTTFDYLGDSIAEAQNSGIKTGNIKVTTNLNINTSAVRQIKITNQQSKTKNK